MQELLIEIYLFYLSFSPNSTFLPITSIWSCSCNMEDNSYVVKMNWNGVNENNSLNGVNGKGLNGNGIQHKTVKGSVYKSKQKSHRQRWNIQPSEMSINTLNPIRAIVDGMKLTPNPEKPMIALSIGEMLHHYLICIYSVCSLVMCSCPELCFLCTPLSSCHTFRGPYSVREPAYR